MAHAQVATPISKERVELPVVGDGALDLADEEDVVAGRALVDDPAPEHRETAVVGRSSECDYQLCHPLISRRHCAFDLRGGEIWVQDLGSLNGTYLNGERVKGPRPVHDGDRLDLTFLPYEICLPKSPEGSVVQRGSVPEAPAEELRPHEVLVVDDNVDLADSTAMLLRLSGHEVRVAYSGRTALEVAVEYQPNIVLMDIGLPEMNGYEVARRLREQPRLKDVVIVAMTGYGQESDRQRSREAGSV